MLYRVEILINKQSLLLFKEDCLFASYPISTAKNGVGQKNNSYQTPLGKHYIIEKSGENAPVNSFFKNRVVCGLVSKFSAIDKDWIVGRVLRLSGVEPGFNLGGDCDSYDRMIYIHASHPLVSLDEPLSKGCIRMLSQDIVELYDLVSIGSRVDIYE